MKQYRLELKYIESYSWSNRVTFSSFLFLYCTEHHISSLPSALSINVNHPLSVPAIVLHNRENKDI